MAQEQAPVNLTVQHFPHDRLPDALANYIAHGYKVFPVWSTDSRGVCRCKLGRAGKDCGSPGKHPVFAEGFLAATDDITVARQWLRDPRHFNYGVVPPADGCIVDLDEDPAIDQWLTLLGEGKVKLTFSVRTPKGWHLYFRHTLGSEHPLRLIGSVTRWGVGDGQGYVLCAYSRHASQEYYEPLHDVRLSDAVILSRSDVDLLAANFSPVSVTDASAEAQGSSSASQGSSPASQGTPSSGHTPTQYPEGSRQQALTSEAGRLLGLGVTSEAALLAQLRDFNEKYCVPPKEDHKVTDIVAWAMKQEPGAVLRFDSADPVTLDIVQRREELTDASEFFADRDEQTQFPAHNGSTAAFDGVLGKAVLAVAPASSADPYAIMGSLLTFAGTLIGGTTNWYRTKQRSALYVCLVGEQTLGRKGTSLSEAESIMDQVEPEWRKHYHTGLGSGEAIVASLSRTATQSPLVTVEPRAVFVEEELSRFLIASGREGSTLDSVLRTAFDGRVLETIRVDRSLRVDGYVAAFLAHITPKELRDRLPGGAMWNGAANRWLWLPVRGHDAQPVTSTLPYGVVQEMRAGLDHARKFTGGMLVSKSAAKMLDDFEKENMALIGMAGLLCLRHTTIALRIALIHALMDGAGVIEDEHVARGIALCERSRAGVPWVFGSATGNERSDRLLAFLTAQPSHTCDGKQLERLLQGRPEQRDEAVRVLIDLGLVEVEKSVSARGRVAGGRPKRMVRLI